MQKQASNSSEPTVVSDPGWVFVLLGVAFVLLGAGVFELVYWLLKLLADWLLSLSSAPFRPAAEILTSLPEPWVAIGVAVVGGAAGAVVSVMAKHESVSVTVSEQSVTVATRGKAATFDHTDIASVFYEEKTLVMLGKRREELTRTPCDLGADPLSKAFIDKGYLWATEDPYKTRFRPWVRNMPGLPAEANAILAARSKALSEDDDSIDPEELRVELSNIGVVVRDKNKKQYWRECDPRR